MLCVLLQCGESPLLSLCGTTRLDADGEDLDDRYIPAEELEDNTPQQYAESFANTARAQVDADEPTLENLQAMLILSMTFYAMGYGRKAWMQMGIVPIPLPSIPSP